MRKERSHLRNTKNPGKLKYMRMNCMAKKISWRQLKKNLKRINPVYHKNMYVSPKGSNYYSNGSIEKPFLTILHAINCARNTRKKPVRITVVPQNVSYIEFKPFVLIRNECV
jgi:hypothetical protein